MERLRRLYETLLDFIFPHEEAVVGIYEKINLGTLSSLPKPQQDPPHNTTSLFSYKDNHVRTIIWQIKYKNDKKIIRAISKLLYEIILEDIADKFYFEHMKPVLIPIPTTKSHKLERGYNQIEELCEAILLNDADSALAYEKDVLIKTKETISQTKTKNKRERLSNMHGVFSVTRTERITNKICIIIDDVITTGATIGEARRALKEVGAKKIYTYTIAH